MTIGKRISELRKEKGLTQKALAEKTGIPVRTLINYENSDREPNAKNMAILERYFQVSGEYLRGESKERITVFIWDDPEVSNAVKSNVQTLLNNLGTAIFDCSDQERKMSFDVLVEFLHVLKLENKYYRTISTSLLQDVFCASTQFIDICINAGQGIDATSRREKARVSALTQYKKSIADALKLFAD